MNEPRYLKILASGLAAVALALIVAGACRARLAGVTEWSDYPEGTYFDVPGNSSFDIAVETGVAEYICSFG